MTKITKIIIGLVVLVIVVWGGVKLFGTKNEKTNEQIKIGIVAPLSGSSGFIGEGLKDAILMAKEELSKTKFNYEVIFEDNQLDPKLTSNATNKLLNIDKVEAIISVTGAPAYVIAPIAEEKRSFIHFGVNNDINTAKGEYNFIHWTHPLKQAKVFIEELKRRNIKRLGLFYINQESTLVLMKFVKDVLKDTDIKIITEQAFSKEEKDFRSLITKAKQNNPDILLLFAFSPQLEILGRQLKETWPTIPLTSITSFELTKQTDLFEGYWYVNAADPTNDFINKFQNKYGRALTIGAANAYDIFNLIVKASESVKSSKKPTVDEIIVQLKNIKEFQGALGSLSIDSEGIVQSEAVVRMIKKGKPITISQ